MTFRDLRRQINYYITYVLPTGWGSVASAFNIWKDLMTDNYESYALLPSVDDPFEECRGWFWATLGEDDVYPLEFLDYLQDMCDKIERGEIKTYPITIDMLDRIEEVLDGME